MSPPLQHRTAALLTGRVAAVLASAQLGVGLLGCMGSNCEPSLCPPAIDVMRFCAPGGCTVDGMPASCSPGGPGACLTQFLPRGSILVVPMQQLHPKFTVVPDLAVQYAFGGGSGTGVFPDPRKASVLLDDVPGVAHEFTGPGGRIIGFNWTPAPIDPGTLQFSYSDGDEPIELGLAFEDAACSAAQPPCGL